MSNSSFDESAVARARTGSTGSLHSSGGPNKLRKKGRMPTPSAATAEDLARMSGPPSPDAASVLSHITFDADTSTETEAPVIETSSEEERGGPRERVLIGASRTTSSTC